MPSPSGTLENKVKLYARSRRLSWEVDHLPPKIRIYLFINGVPYSQYAQPVGGDLGDALFTDEFGHAEGSLVIPRNAEEKFLVGEIRITFCDHPTNIASSNFITESTFYSQPDDTYDTDQGSTKSTRQPIPLRKVSGGNVKETDIDGNSTSILSNRLSPLSQTFYVDPATSPLGVFVMSVDLFFLQKDDSVPVSVELRDTVSGVPVNDNYISGSAVRKYPNQVAVPASITAAGEGRLQVTGSADATVAGQTQTLVQQIETYLASVVYKSGNQVDTFRQDFTPGTATTPSSLSLSNIYDDIVRSPSTIYVTLLPGFNNYSIQRKNPIESYNLTVTTETAGLTEARREYTDPRTGTKYSAGVTIGVNFMVRNGVMYKFPDAPTNTVTYTITGGSTPTNVTLSLTEFAEQLIAGATVSGTPSATSTSLDAAGAFPFTNFQFDHPIYLAPGRYYALCVRTSSDKYLMVSSTADRPLTLGSGPRIPEALSGAQFRPSNSGVPLRNNNSDLCFVLYKCKFDTGIKSLFLENLAPDSAFVYDAAKLKYTLLQAPGIATIQPRARYTEEVGTRTSFLDVNANKTTVFDSKKKVQSQGDQTIEMIFQSNSQDFSPVLDKEKTIGVLYKYDVSPYEVDLSTAELANEANPNRARYISKMVTLLPGFESNGMEVRLDVNRKVGTDVEVFVKVLSPEDPEPPAKRPWKKMVLVSNEGVKSYVGFSETEFVTEYYQLLTPDLEYEDTVTLGDNNTPAKFTDFNRYIIKIVFYSSNTTVPKIKNLFASACIDVPSAVLSGLAGSTTTNRTSLRIGDLADVSDEAPTDGQVLAYNSVTGLWEAKSGSGANVLTLNDLTDVQAPSPNQNQVLAWDGSKWAPGTINLPTQTVRSGLDLMYTFNVEDGAVITQAIGPFTANVTGYVIDYEIFANTTLTSANYSLGLEDYLCFQVSEDGENWFGVGDSFPYLPWTAGNQRGGAFGSTEICFNPATYGGAGLPYVQLGNYQNITYSGRFTIQDPMTSNRLTTLISNYGYQSYPTPRLAQGAIVSYDNESGSPNYSNGVAPDGITVTTPIYQVNPPRVSVHVNRLNVQHQYIRFYWNMKIVSGLGWREPQARFRDGTRFRLYKIINQVDPS